LRRVGAFLALGNKHGSVWIQGEYIELRGEGVDIKQYPRLVRKPPSTIERLLNTRTA
jgi:hypothetical protein